MEQYYRDRAPVYELVYSYPERQPELRGLETLVTQTFAGQTVLEIAAGTGYWTQFIARSASSILATDGAAETLAQLELKFTDSSREPEPVAQVATRVVDAYQLGTLGNAFSAAFAGCWFSHVPRERQVEWLTQLHSQLLPGASVMLLDNSRAQCERLPITRRDDFGNSYQERAIDGGDGTRFEVLKNFPSEQELEELLQPLASQFHFVELEHYWYCRYVVG